MSGEINVLIPKYKYDEFTPEEFDFYSEIYKEETFTYMKELPHGTCFSVLNGNWKGKVIHKNGSSFLQTTINDNICINEENTIPITEKSYLWIKIIDK